MKIHTTNYRNTLIEPAEDSTVQSEIPPQAEKVSIARQQYDLLISAPYRYTSDEITFDIYARRNDIAESDRPAAEAHFFAKGQPCFRASPLTKRYGWAVHYNDEQKMSLVEQHSELHDQLRNDAAVNVVKAMRSKKKL